MKSCMSGENFMASDGGDTDYADQTASEVRTRHASRVVDWRSGSTTPTLLQDFCDRSHTTTVVLRFTVSHVVLFRVSRESFNDSARAQGS